MRRSPLRSSKPFSSVIVVSSVQALPLRSRRWPRPRATAVSKVNHASTTPSASVASPSTAKALGLRVGQPCLQHLADGLGAFLCANVPGEGDQVAPVAIGLEQRDRGIDVLPFQRGREIGQPGAGDLRRMSGQIRHLFVSFVASRVRAGRGRPIGAASNPFAARFARVKRLRCLRPRRRSCESLHGAAGGADFARGGVLHVPTRQGPGRRRPQPSAGSGTGGRGALHALLLPRVRLLAHSRSCRGCAIRPTNRSCTRSRSANGSPRSAPIRRSAIGAAARFAQARHAAILQESLATEGKALDLYRDLLRLVEGRSVALEEFARQMIYAEELHAADVDKMLRKPGEVRAFAARND